MRPLVVVLLLLSSSFAQASDLEWMEFTSTGNALFDRVALASLQHYEEQARFSVRYTDLLIEHYGLDRTDETRLRIRLTELTDNMSEADSDALEQLARDRGMVMDYNLAVSPSTVRDWEPEFGGNADYWKLLSWAEQCVYWDEDGKFLAYKDFRPEFYEPLIESIVRGTADAETLLLLRRIYYVADPGYVENALKSEAESRQRRADETKAALDSGEEAPEPDDPEMYHSREALQASHDKAVEMVGRIGIASVPELYQAALSLDPGWAQVHYLQADDAADRGDFAHALAEMRAGNAAPHNEPIGIFPVSFIDECITEGRLPGSRQIPGLLFVGSGAIETEFQTSYPSPIGWSGSTEFAALSTLEQMELFAAALEEEVRNSHPDYRFRTTGVPGVQLLKRVKTFLGSKLDVESKQRLDQLLERVMQSDRALKDEWYATLDAPAPYWDTGPYPLTAAEFIAGLRPLQEHYYNDSLAERQRYSQRIVPLLEELRNFDVMSLTLKAD